MSTDSPHPEHPAAGARHPGAPGLRPTQPRERWLTVIGGAVMLLIGATGNLWLRPSNQPTGAAVLAVVTRHVVSRRVG